MDITIDDIIEEMERCEQQKRDRSLHSPKAQEIIRYFIDNGLKRYKCHHWLRKAGIKFSDQSFFKEWKKHIDAKEK